MPAPPRVALVSSEYPPHIFGGLGVHVSRMTAALAGEVDFDLYVPDYPDYPEDRPGLRIHRVPVPSARRHHEAWLLFCRAAAELAQSGGAAPDLVHCHDWMTAAAGIRLREVWRRPLAFHIHLPQIEGPLLDLESLGIAAADVVVTVSDSARRELEARPEPPRRVAVVLNGVDGGEFRPAAGWPDDGGYVLFVGRLVAQKGVDLLLKAFPAVLARCPEARLVIVGDGELELYLQRVVRTLGFPDRVTFAGWQAGEDLVRLYQEARVVAMPSYYEPFGIVALEALACGRPLVGSRIGGLEEIVEDGVQGFLVEPGDHLALARRLVALLVDPELRRKMGSAARARAETFSWHRAAHRMAGIYAELAAAPGPGPGSPSPSNQETIERLESGAADAARVAIRDLLRMEPRGGVT
jgi:glycosyltransferase involved in cell wall biosynthesis